MSNPQLEQALSNIPMVLHDILQDMEGCVGEQEQIIHEEREAMKIFDGDELAALVERRARSQSELAELESRCRRLVNSSADDTRLETVIEMHAAEQADVLQSKRIGLVRRMQTLERDHIENHIRLRAAWNVTTSILQEIGAIEPASTYQNAAYTRQQVAR